MLRPFKSDELSLLLLQRNPQSKTHRIRQGPQIQKLERLFVAGKGMTYIHTFAKG